jgi:hypothetical protein
MCLPRRRSAVFNARAMTLQLPIDLTSLPPFRLLEASLGPTGALWAWWAVWRELGYLSQEGLAPGRIRAEDKPAMVQALAVPGEEPMGGDAVWDLLLSSRLLKADGPDWVCARFSLLHSGPSHRSQAQRGGDLKAYHGRQKDVNSVAFQQALQISESKMVDEHGEPLSREMRERVTRLIVSCDNALFKNLRPTHGYTEGLVQDALRVLAKFSDEQIAQVCLFVAEHRNNPMLTTTERLLPVFGDITRLLEGRQ